MHISIRSTSTRTFVLYPVLVAAELALTGRRPHLRWLPILAWGYLQYRLAGRYRSRIGGGGPGMSNPPERLVTSGIYGVSRNPMYLGHQIFLAGLALVDPSPVTVALFGLHVAWFDTRAQRDEERLVAQFGPAYESYRDRVPRWL